MVSDLTQFDIVIAGGGPVGLLAAVGLARAGVERIGLIAPDFDTPIRDGRTTALMQGAVAYLDRIGLWDELRPSAESLDVMTLLDRTSHGFRAPDVSFRAEELGPEPFGWNIPNADLVAVLRAHVGDTDIHVLRDTVADVTLSPDGTGVETISSNGEKYLSRALFAADGRQSLCRRRAGIAVNTWSYPQKAVVACFSHTRPHNNVSTEFHRDAGPLTVVPLPGNRSSLVWVETPEETARVLALDDVAFAHELEQHTDRILGDISALTERAAFPLSGLTARAFARGRTFLLGEAAHVIPPIGAQGLNLGFRDVTLAVELIAGAARNGSDPGNQTLVDRFDRLRRRDVVPRTVAVDILNRSLIHRFAPLQGLRSLGLSVLDRVGPVRRYMMQQGIGPVEPGA